MFKPSVGAAVAVALSCSVLFGCSKKAKDEEPKPVVATAVKPPPPAPPPPPPAPVTGDVPFKGTYSKTAETTYRNGRRYPNAATNGVATMQIDAGKATFVQTFAGRGGQKQTITQVYTFTTADVKPVGTNGYDVTMVFQSMTGDTKNYNPDKNRPKIEARKQTAGWEIGLTTTDTNGVMGGVEFR